MRRLILLAALVCTPAAAAAPMTEWAWLCTFTDGSTARVEPKNQAYFRCEKGAEPACIGFHASFVAQGDKLVATVPGGPATVSISSALEAEETVGAKTFKASCTEGPPMIYDPSTLR